MRKSLVKELPGSGMIVYVADVHAPTCEFSCRTGLLALLGEAQHYPTMDIAV